MRSCMRAGFCSSLLGQHADAAVSLRVVLFSLPSVRKQVALLKSAYTMLMHYNRSQTLDISVPLSTCTSIFSFILHTRIIFCMTQSRRLACAQAQNPHCMPALTMRNMCTGKRDTADKLKVLSTPGTSRRTQRPDNTGMAIK